MSVQQTKAPAKGATKKAIAEMLGKQHSRIYQAAGSVQIARAAIDTLDRDGQEDQIVALWCALGLIQDTLEDIASHIDPRVALNQEASHAHN